MPRKKKRKRNNENKCSRITSCPKCTDITSILVSDGQKASKMGLLRLWRLPSEVYEQENFSGSLGKKSGGLSIMEWTRGGPLHAHRSTHPSWERGKETGQEGVPGSEITQWKEGLGLL